MKKIYIAMTALATVSLVACQQEKSFDELNPIGKDGVAFTLQNISTRSAEEDPTAVKGMTIPLDVQVGGESFYLEETIEELNPISPATKGTPAYTVNVGDLYDNMGVYANAGSFGGDVTFELMDQYEHKGEPNDPKAPENLGWRYRHNYSGDPWPDEDTKVNFFLRMPASDPGVSDLAYSETDKSIAFDYASSLKGEDQQDILFAQTSISKTEHNSYLPNGAPVLMYHALTGVKFRTGNKNSGTTKTIITKVEFTGLNATGHCIVTPSSGSVVWSNLGSKGVTFSQDFDNPTYSQTSDNTISYGDYEEGTSQFGESWYKAAADNNLNDENGSLTFWFIPQEMTEDVVLKVTFCVKTPDTSGSTGGGMITHTIDFGKQLAAKNVEWKAGQLRTYTLEPKDVDVAIFDKIEGLKKSNLHVTNTGNVDEYVRMLLVGNWYDKDGNILVGYKYAGDEDPSELDEGDDINTMFTPWYRGDELYGTYFDDTFQKAEPLASSKWVIGEGNYFYYTEKIGAGEILSGTDALFKYYDLTEYYETYGAPVIYIPTTTSNVRVPAEGVHLVMEVVVQAISAIDSNGNEFANWEAAWNSVLTTE